MITPAVQQLLYGYASGHRRIAGSFKPDPLLEQTLARLSDPVMVGSDPGSDGQVAGLPIADTSLFALLRTWRAADSPRPGAVWTHVLLLDDEALRTELNPAMLLTAMSPPTDRDLDRYSLPLEFLPVDRIWDVDAVSRRVAIDDALRVVLGKIYTADGAICLEASDPLRYAWAVLGLWLQQWPALRRAFSFAIGGAPRTLQGAQPDLEVLSPQAISRANSSWGILVAEAEVAERLVEAPDWTHFAMRDLTDSRGSFRRYLAKYGEEFGPDRTSFGCLADVYAQAAKNANRSARAVLRTTIDAACEHFPDPTSGSLLKHDLLGREASPDFMTVRFNEFDLLEEALHHSECIDRIRLGLQKRAHELGRNDVKSAWRLAQAAVKVGGSVASDLIRGVAAGIGAKDMCAWVSSDWDTGLALIDRAPRLATARCLWSISGIPSGKVINALWTQGSPPEEQLKTLVAAICSEGRSDALSIISTRAPECVAMAIRWLDHGQSTGRSQEVVEGLRRSASDVVLAVHACSPLQPTTLKQLLGGIGFTGDDFSHADAGDWIPLVDSISFEDDLIAVRLFTLGRLSAGTRQRELLAKSFALLHQRLAEDRMGRRAWQELETQLPTAPWWSDWDKCDRLRRAFAELFPHAQGHPDWFAFAANAVHQRKEMYRLLERTDGGRELARRIREEGPHTADD